MMPHDLPHWNTVYTCHRQWCKAGVWKRINDALAGGLTNFMREDVKPASSRLPAT